MKPAFLKTILLTTLVVAAAGVRAAAPVVVALGANSQGVSAPAGVAVDAAGHCYVTDPAAGRVTVFDAFGRVAAVKSGFAAPLAIAVDGSGNIYLSEEKTGSVRIFNPQWQPLGSLGAGDGEFIQPTSIALDPADANTVFVGDSRANRIKVYQAGAFAFSFGGYGQANGQFDFPAGVCVSGAGEVFVVDQNNDRVQVFDRAGGFLRRFKFGGMLGPSGRKQGVIVDNANRLFVADTFQGIVKVYDATSGGFLADIGGFGAAPGQLRLPGGLALDGFNRLRVASMNNSRVEIFGLDDFIHFTANPPGQLVGTGTPVSFSVMTGGAGQISFQWRKGTNELVGATNATLSLSGTTLADAGDYAVVVTGLTNSITSPVAHLSLLTPPAILTNPASLVVVQGDAVRFDVAATGDDLSFQWRRNGCEIAAATGPTLLLNSVPAAAGDYTVAITNAVGAVVSDPAQLTVLSPPAVTSDPVSQTVTAGGAVAFEILAQGDLLSYQWKFNGVDIIGANSSKFELADVQTNWSGDYSAVVTSPAGSASSGAATLTVTAPPLPPQIGAFTLLADGNVRFTVTGSAGNLSVIASTNLMDWVELTNVASATGTFDFVDESATNETRRFYRARFWP